MKELFIILYTKVKFHQLIKIKRYLDWLIIVAFSFVPLLLKFPYKINIYLAWEGAYRIANGEIPYADFGLPTGYTFWLIPAAFFKLFGPSFVSLIQAQTFINLMGFIALRSLLKSLRVLPYIILVALLIYGLSYSIINFWPWYNHTVVVFELIGFAFLLKAFELKRPTISYIYILGSSLFIFMAVFTKQDIGGFATIIAISLIIYNIWQSGDYRLAAFFFIGFILFASLFIVPFLKYDFSYWFNFGQEPHNSRIVFLDILNNFFSESSFLIRFYIIVILGLFIFQKGGIYENFEVKEKGYFLILTFGILLQVIVTQITTYVPDNVHAYYHTLTISFILVQIKETFAWKKSYPLILIVFSVLLWSSDVWKYTSRVIQKFYPSQNSKTDFNKISKNTYRIDKVSQNRGSWKLSDYPTLDRIYLPKETLDGIVRLKKMQLFRNPKGIRVLNMSELTFLSEELNFSLEKGQNHPLWYHKNVALFDREIKHFCENIYEYEYDLVLFEVIPHLNDFYPSEVRACLNENYILLDQFLAPRETAGAFIEVYVRPNK